MDPPVVDPEPLAKVLAGAGVMMGGGGRGDLEVLGRACQLLPSRLFDTQVAAGFIGHGSASLASLVERFLHLRLAKGDRLTDWSRRPLTASQLSYAASDVAHLLPLADVISEQLSRRGRLGWAEEECATLLTRPLAAGDPEEAWWKLRDNRQFQGVSRAIAQEVAAWRRKGHALSMCSPAWSCLTWLCSRSPTRLRPAPAPSARRGASTCVISGVAPTKRSWPRLLGASCCRTSSCVSPTASK